MKHQNGTSVVIDFPELTEKKGVNEQYIKEAVAAVLYYNGTLSEKEACSISNTTRRKFEEEVLPKFELSITGADDEYFSKTSPGSSWQISLSLAPENIPNNGIQNLSGLFRSPGKSFSILVNPTFE